MANDPTFSLQFSRFKTVSYEEKKKMMEDRKAKSTNRATKLWTDCLRDYLVEKDLPPLESVMTSCRKF